MLDLYKDESKKVFKIMDVIIDQEIDVNMKRPLHLWYYQDKAKQEERLKTIIERHKKKKKKSSSSMPTMQLSQYVNPPQHLIGQSSQPVPPPQVLPAPPQLQLKKSMNYPPSPSIASGPTCLINRRHMNGAPPPHAIPSVPMPPRMPPNLPNANPMNMMPFMCNGSFLASNHPRATRPILPNPPPHHFPSSSSDINSTPNVMANTGQIRFPPLLQPQYPLPIPPPNMMPAFHRPPNNFPCNMPQGPVPRPASIPPAALILKNNIRGLQQNVMIKHGTQRNGMISQKTNKNNKW